MVEPVSVRQLKDREVYMLRAQQARAEAANQKFQEVVANHGEPFNDIARYFIATNYVRAFQALASAPNTRLVVVPMESSALAGGIVQAMQLFRDDGPSGGAPPEMPPPPQPPQPSPMVTPPPMPPVASPWGNASPA